jgi:hypothetical protein
MKTKLSNIQLELLNLFSNSVSDADLKELRSLLKDFYAKKSIKLADEVWDGKKLTAHDMENWLNDSKQ